MTTTPPETLNACTGEFDERDPELREHAAPDELADAFEGRRIRRLLVGLSIGLVLTVILGVAIGPVAVSPVTVARVVGHHLIGWPATADWSRSDDAIVWQVRLPRVLLGAMVGGSLAVVGVALQAMVRNVLADPYLLGVTSGASTGAAAAILFGFGAGLGGNSLSVTAFVGAMGAAVAVLAIARGSGPVTSIRLLLAGVSVGYLLHAATSFLVFASDSPEGTRAVMFWLLGSLAQATWSSLIVVSLVTAACSGALFVCARRIDVLAIGDETARSLGIDPSRFRMQLLVSAASWSGQSSPCPGGSDSSALSFRTSPAGSRARPTAECCRPPRSLARSSSSGATCSPVW